MKAEEATQGKQTVLHRRKVGRILCGKFLAAGLQPGQQTGLPQVSADEQNNIKLSKTSDREQREETDSWKEASGLLLVWERKAGHSALGRPYPKLANEHPSSGRIQVDRPGVIFSDGFDE